MPDIHEAHLNSVERSVKLYRKVEEDLSKINALVYSLSHGLSSRGLRNAQLARIIGVTESTVHKYLNRPSPKAINLQGREDSELLKLLVSTVEDRDRLMVQLDHVSCSMFSACVDANRSGVTLSSLAESAGLSYSTLRAGMERQGWSSHRAVPVVRDTKSRTAPLSPDRITKIQTLYASGLSYREIGKIVGMSHVRIGAILRKYGKGAGYIPNL